MREIYINREAMERAKTREEKAAARFFTGFLWFVLGIIAGYVWLWMQGGGE